MIIGVDYQPGGQGAYKPQEGKDALTDADVCLRDATVMQKLGVREFTAQSIGSVGLTMSRSTPSASTISTLPLTIPHAPPSSTLLEST